MSILALTGVTSAEPILNNDTSPTSVFKSVCVAHQL